jgi:hypothetical protein
MPRRPRVFADGAVYHVYARFGRGVRVKDLAERRNAFPDTISRWVTRGTRRRMSDAGLARTLTRLEQRLSGERK